LFQVDLEKPYNSLWFCYEKAPLPLFPPFQKRREQYPRHFTTLRRPWNYLWCCYVRALVLPLHHPFKGQGRSAPIMHPRSGVPGYNAFVARSTGKFTLLLLRCTIIV